MGRLRVIAVATLGAVLLAACGATAAPTTPASSGTPDPPGTPAPTATDTTAEAPEASEDVTPSAMPSDALPAPVDIVDAGALVIPATRDVDWTVVVDGEAWVAGLGDGIGVLDATGTLTRSAAVRGWCESMDVGFESIWAASCDPAGVIRIDPKTAAVDRMQIDVPIPDSEASVGAGEGAVWLIAGIAGDQLLGIDPATLRVASTFTVPIQGAGVRAGLGGVWVTRPSWGELVRVDPASGTVVATIPLGNGPRFLAIGEGAVWVLNANDGTVSRVDPTTNAVAATINVGWPVSGGDITVGGGSVWVRGGPALMARLDPATNAVTERYGPPPGSGSVAADDDAVWATAHDIATIWRLPLR